MLKINKEDKEIKIKFEMPNLSILRNIPFILICLLCVPFVYYFIYFSGLAGLFIIKSMITSVPIIYNAPIFLKMLGMLVCISLLIDACFIYDLFPKYGILNELNNLNIEHKEDLKAFLPCLVIFLFGSLFYLVGSFEILNINTFFGFLLFFFNSTYAVFYALSLLFVVFGHFEIIKIKKDI